MGAKYFLLWLSRRFGKKRFQITNISEKTGTISINFYLTNLYLWIIIKTQHKMLFFTFPIGNWYVSVLCKKHSPFFWLYLSHRELIHNNYWYNNCQYYLYLSHRELILVHFPKMKFTSILYLSHRELIHALPLLTQFFLRFFFTFPIGNWYHIHRSNL